MVGRAFYGLRKVFWELGCLAFLAFYVRMGRQRIVGFTANCQYEIGLLGWTDGIFFCLFFPGPHRCGWPLFRSRWRYALGREDESRHGVNPLVLWSIEDFFSIGPGKGGGRHSPCAVNDDVYDFPTRNRISSDLLYFSHLWLL